MIKKFYKRKKYKGIRNRPEMNRWAVSIKINGEYIEIGCFFRLQDAIEAYDKKAIELYGSKAITNKQLIIDGILDPIPENLDFQIPKVIDLPNEIWKDISNYKDIYMVSNFGRVKSLVANKNCHREKLLKTRKSIGGYHQAKLRGKDYYVHRLVCETFIPNPNNYPQTNHKDLNKENNMIENLEWVTGSQNIVHFVKIKGHPLAKLRAIDALNIREKYIKGIKIAEIVKEYNVTRPTIDAIIKRKTYKYV
ncbi:MAG: NUMOD4 domain-containing protein [Nanoarchaeota archaeon]